ncbi:MAG TPA: hypothetical protein VJ964_17320, partial [Balneolaceae bacterium]|nr:hypothetical protein [Balneolaceae bacterium]
MSASGEVAGPGDRTTYSVTVTNTGTTDLTNISVDIVLPDLINGFSPSDGLSCYGTNTNCNANETATWQVGTLSPGYSKTVFYQVQIASDATAGTITSTSTASATGSSDATASLDITIDASPLLRLSVAPESGPAVAGEPFTYTLTYGNIGSTPTSNAVLTMNVPAGTQFQSATGGGVESGGTVTWNIGVIGAGKSGQFQMTVIPNGSLTDGQVLETRGQIEPNVTNEPDAMSSIITPIHAAGPLHVEYSFSQTAPGPGDYIDLTLVASN